MCSEPGGQRYWKGYAAILLSGALSAHVMLVDSTVLEFYILRLWLFLKSWCDPTRRLGRSSILSLLDVESLVA